MSVWRTRRFSTVHWEGGVLPDNYHACCLQTRCLVTDHVSLRMLGAAEGRSAKIGVVKEWVRELHCCLQRRLADAGRR